MALYATNRFPGDGSTTSYEFNFVGKYIDRTHVKVYQEDNATGARTPIAISDSNFLNDTTLRNLPVTPVGKTLVIYRDTPKPPLVNFTNGARFTEANLDTATRQGSFIAVESADALSTDGLAGLISSVETARGQAAASAATATTKAAEALVSAVSAKLANDNAVAAASAIGPIKFYDTYAQALGAILGLASGDLIEVAQDETCAGARTRYKVQAGALVFVVNLDQTELDLAAATGASLVGFQQAGAGAVARTVEGKLREIVSVKDFGAVGDGVADDTNAIESALTASKYVEFPQPTVGYRMTRKLTTNGHTLVGLGRAAELYGTSSTTPVVILFDGVSGDCVLNTGSKSVYENLWFKAKDWSVTSNGLAVERFVDVNNCMFTHFNGYGAYFFADPATPDKNPYHSTFTGCVFSFNAKHGIAVLNGANALTFIDCQARWNGSPSYGVQPSVAGVYDGLIADGKFPGFPTSATAFEPQQLLVIGGDYSYNSRYGHHFVRASDSAVVGGYIENNLVSDLRVVALYGSVIDNPMTQQAPSLALVQQDPTTASMNLYTHPNSIIVRGFDYGTGIKQASTAPSGYRSALKTLVAAGSSGEVRVMPTVAGGVSVESDNNLAFGFGATVRMAARRWSLGSFEPTSTANANYLSAPTGLTENDLICYLITNSQFGAFNVANGGGANAANAFFVAPKNSVTLRSINAGGTVNASGADYAEYESNNGMCIPKGAIVGFKVNGTLTLTYSEAVRFGIKSTDPAYVGGDTWAAHLGEEPKKPADETAESLAAYEEAKADFQARLEAARATVDRVAYSGKVPVNVLGATPGQYIVASEGGDGEIVGVSVNNPDFSEYRNAVGRVNRVLADGRAEVAVIVH